MVDFQHIRKKLSSQTTNSQVFIIKCVESESEGICTEHVFQLFDSFNITVEAFV